MCGHGVEEESPNKNPIKKVLLKITHYTLIISNTWNDQHLAFWSSLQINGGMSASGVWEQKFVSTDANHITLWFIWSC